ncbi:hypothetical protein TNIN_233091 [Trichonephila inaurata madagascariensis]|uniref:Uncharacterized protein n=1 Tax=Trichonephila inaurata madagascariensis TaxID=2747483 RepID=A0A8X6YLH2_9ARAC|nr:hypothetical protein TNIN_233091 [Trichonephila inaurata madagascariensis]
MHLSLAITQLKQNLENCPETADKEPSINYEDVEPPEITRVDQIKSDASINNHHHDLDAFLTGFENISETSEQISAFSSELTLDECTKYTFYDDNGKKFFIDNADFGIFD